MALRVRRNGDMMCAATTTAEEGDTYIDDQLHYEMSVVHGVIVTLPMPEHMDYPRWWWRSQAPSRCDMRLWTQTDRTGETDD